MTGPSVPATPPSASTPMASRAVDVADDEPSHLHEQEYSWDAEGWREHFLNVASRVRSMTNAQTVLDAGCSRGLFVQALREVGVEAVGFDSSPDAIGAAHENVREFVKVGALTDPIEGKYDLISCIGVLEQVPDDQAQLAIDRICAATDLVLFSSTPTDFEVPTHVNIHPTADWAASFAERGFYRRLDVDTDFLSPWAVLFARVELSPRELVHRYESNYAALRAEVVQKRAALLEADRQMRGLSGGVDLRVELDEQVRQYEQQVQVAQTQERVAQDHLARAVAAEHRQLTTRDHIIGLEATADEQVRQARVAKARLANQREKSLKLAERLQKQRNRAVEAERKLQRAQRRADRLQAELNALLGSRTWRWARRARRPFGGR